MSEPAPIQPLTASQEATLRDVVRIARDGFKFIGEALSNAQAIVDRDMLNGTTLPPETLRELVPDASEQDLARYVNFWLTVNGLLEADGGALRKAFRHFEGQYNTIFNR